MYLSIILLSSLYAASAESGASAKVGDVPARRAGVVVARLHADVGAGQAAAVHRRHRRLKVLVQAHDLRLLQPWKGKSENLLFAFRPARMVNVALIM